MTFNNARPKPGIVAKQAAQHVIATYSHRQQAVECVCGWRGSSASDMGPSAWTRHVAEFRTVKR